MKTSVKLKSFLLRLGQGTRPMLNMQMLLGLVTQVTLLFIRESARHQHRKLVRSSSLFKRKTCLNNHMELLTTL
jgi:hypothetical protein